MAKRSKAHSARRRPAAVTAKPAAQAARRTIKGAGRTGKAASKAAKPGPAAVKAKAATAAVRTVPKEQWELPVSVNSEGRLVRLRDFVRRGEAKLSLSQLTPAQRADLVAARIEAQPKFELAMVGAGIVDKRRAAAEVRAQSPVGQTLIEIEQLLIDDMVQRAQREVR